jgi:ferredoxin, 2Fe-2S
MPRVVYVEPDGTSRDVEAPVGESLMRAAISNGVKGIDADCGGQCACATCHIYVDEPWLSRLEPQGEMELSMLSFASTTAPDSRLSCQIAMRDDLDGLIARLPLAQH